MCDGMDLVDPIFIKLHDGHYINPNFIMEITIDDADAVWVHMAQGGKFEATNLTAKRRLLEIADG